MGLILRLWIVSIPLFAVGFPLDSRFVSLSYLAALMVALIGVFAGGRELTHGLLGPFRSFAVLLLAFFAAATIGYIGSRYESEVLFGRGAVQLLGIGVSFTAAIILGANLSLFRKNADRERLLRIYLVWLGIVALVACGQFIVNNALQTQAVGFSVLNALGTEMWRPPGQIGILFRAGSVAPEPAHLARILAPALPFALLRIGFPAPYVRAEVSTLIPMWAAVAVVAAVFMTISLLAIALVMVVGSLLVIGLRLRVRVLIGLLVASVILGGSALIVGAGRAEDVLTKLDSLSVFFVNESELGSMETEYISAIAVQSNRLVAMNNLAETPFFGGGIGTHALSYFSTLPSFYFYLMESSGILGLNAEDAASLALRLLSEVGLVGATLYILLFAAPVVSLVQRAREKNLASCLSSDKRWYAIQLAVGAGLGGVLSINLIRYGAYLDGVLWAQLGFALGFLRGPLTEGVVPAKRRNDRSASHVLTRGAI